MARIEGSNGRLPNFQCDFEVFLNLSISFFGVVAAAKDVNNLLSIAWLPKLLDVLLRKREDQEQRKREEDGGGGDGGGLVRRRRRSRATVTAAIGCDDCGGRNSKQQIRSEI
ncbi:hypothetical protein NE237_000633 [Protea cynaroides]|uniref:Uncharacterized protein n=1 Tax=Protea cynaroides TaxID=273540 RepID=A0A9Q0KRT7_9MAGN|nr:hypothetical protein NE237_000633 [Protea cynaroides]